MNLPISSEVGIFKMGYKTLPLNIDNEASITIWLSEVWNRISAIKHFFTGKTIKLIAVRLQWAHYFYLPGGVNLSESLTE